ncbi:hypothetical protein [Methylocaldum sp. RMAD-M]|jgi:hypothetical protein|uniref:hypothetical protein n=1 Tax=Methylocaldum sp. RMAD-M TaxID=2806557 RepID=UPI001AE707C1|nr:hypothetical protein [Methylocaldum sp. RMAD-M]MBP1149845.1 hypothetical protein [Methylocaldum sp. RMAD-M]
MHTGTVSFTAKTSGLEIEEITVESAHPNINFLTCPISEGGAIVINANLEEVYYEDWPVQEVVQEVQQFVDVLSFEFNRPIHSLRESGYSIKKNDGSGMSQVSSSLVLVWDVVSDTLKPGGNSLEQVKQRFLNFRNSSSLRTYSSAIQQEDPIARFIFLYNIILTLSGDKQAVVDTNIISIAPETPRTPSPIKPNMQETVYTRLRNEIAHNRVGADFGATSAEVNQWAPELGRITRQLVLNNG